MSAVRFWYGTGLGRATLRAIMKLRLDRILIRFLWSPWSRVLNGWYIRRNRIPVTRAERKSFRSFRDLFARTKGYIQVDMAPEHLISPCDGWMSALTIDCKSRFTIRDSHYRIQDLLEDAELARNYSGGMCLVFRLSASDYHHYCYIDDGYQAENHPIADELNQRSWCLLTTEHFGPVVQCEIGAPVVGGIFNQKENTRFCKGTEKGHFELAGSTIVLLFETSHVTLRPEIMEQLIRKNEVRVSQGEWIGTTERSIR